MSQMSAVLYDHLFDFDVDHKFPKLSTQLRAAHTNSKVCDLKTINFVEPYELTASSVGDFYKKNMREFMALSKDIFDYVYATAPLNIGGVVSLEEVSFIASQVMPLGAFFDTNDAYVDAPNNMKLAQAFSCQIPEVATIIACLFDKKPWLQEYFGKTLALEKISQSLCIGYNPNTDVPMVDRVKHDSGFKNEYLIADVMYPWVTQPLKQLRMMIPALPKETISKILKVLESDDNKMLMPHTDYCHEHTYDCVTDFISYMMLRTDPTPYKRDFTRQIWTPFFGIANYELLKTTIKDEKLLERIDKAFLASKRLYVEILKTGFRYEAQYAVLGGMAGRFLINGSTAGMKHFYGQDQYSKPAKDIASEIQKDVYGTPWT